MAAVTMFLLLFATLLLLARRYPQLRGALLAAVLVRLLLLWVHHNIFRLIPGRADVYTFYFDAIHQSEFGFWGSLATFNISSSNGYSAILGALFSLLGPSWFIGEVGNIVLSLVVVVLTFKLARNCGADLKAAKTAAMIMAVVPSTAQYGVVALREMVLVTAFMFGLVELTANKFHLRSVRGIGLFCLWCMVAAAFHGAMVIAVAGLVAGLYAFQIWAADGVRMTRNQIATNVVLMVLVVATLASINGWVNSVGLNKVSGIDEGNFVDNINHQTSNASRGNSAYLTGLSATNPVQLILFAPLRVVYFLFSPMPWDVRSFGHLLGFLDAWLYLWVVVMIWRGFKAKVMTQRSLVVLGVVSTLILAFAFGTSNAGTAIRHRAKMSYALVAVACVARQRSRAQRLQTASRRPRRFYMPAVSPLPSITNEKPTA